MTPTMPRRVKETPAMRARLDAERAKVTAKGAFREYRFINGLGDAYRTKATSAAEAARNINVEYRITATFNKMQVLENGTWVWVL